MNSEKYNDLTNKVLTPLNFIKEYLAIFLLIPLLIGGIIQILELSHMSISFIRFFSSTQLLPDGLLVLFIIFCCFLFYIVYLIMVTLDKEKENLTIIKNQKNRAIRLSKEKIVNFTDKKPKKFNHFINYHNIIPTKVIVVFSIVFIFMVLGFFYSLFLNQKEITIFSILIFALLVLFLYKSVFGEPLKLLYWRIKSYFSNKNWGTLKYQDNIEEFFYALYVLLIISLTLFLSIYMIKNIIFIFNEQYMLPNNIKNLEKIKPIIKDVNYKTNEIVYFNDKYIFIKHSNSDKNSTYEILKLDKLF